MRPIARTVLPLLTYLALTTSMGYCATSPRYAASVQDLESRTRATLQTVGDQNAPLESNFQQTQQLPKATFRVVQPWRSNSRIIEDLTEAFTAYLGLHAIACAENAVPQAPEAVAENPIAQAVWRRLNEMTGGRVSANLGFQTQERIEKQRLVPQRTLDAKVTVGLFGPQFSRARALGRCR